MFAHLFISTAVASALVLALSAPQSARAAAGDCATATTQLAINACTGRTAAAAGARENVAYTASLKAATGRRRALLISAEHAWRTYRDANCAAVGELFAGGSVLPSVIAGCQARADDARTAELVRQRTPSSAM